MVGVWISPIRAVDPPPRTHVLWCAASEDPAPPCLLLLPLLWLADLFVFQEGLVPASNLKGGLAVIGSEQPGADSVKSKGVADGGGGGEAKAEEHSTWAYPMSLGECIHPTETMVCVCTPQGHHRKVLFYCFRYVPFPPRVVLCCLEESVSTQKLFIYHTCEPK